MTIAPSGTRALIVGLAGHSLTEGERAFLRDVRPWGLILFARNVDTPEQVAALVADARAVLGWRVPVLIDQEGGRVQRLRPPHWLEYPPAENFGLLYDNDRTRALNAVRLNSRLLAHDLLTLGIDVDCLPVADLRLPEGHGIIGNRAYGSDAAIVAPLAGAAAQGLLDGGVLPVLKHLPGHGRAPVDSHEHLPSVSAPRAVLEETDFQPFKALNALPLGMTAHVVYEDIDAQNPATTSRVVLDEVVRGLIGFDGALMSDDLSMKALSGSFAERARASIAAGCDLLLHCNGDPAEMAEVAGEAPVLVADALTRTERALALRITPPAFDIEAARRDMARLLDPAL
ncbi:glycosyl hydrolase [Azorhizobium oxalatiphilum]|uniref:beta-N-acetylhexosaminidase n=1 Tax=Azorhizobium oxalatiphilum TaxID=980631 RepID=A0A917C4R0_9HYPH|nr:beta-N-acetylhexosaminidase [Azorhizobium oxalatiphilum]GGF72077.1 glycosyl hydrolase [Azorhizobium oxalatiphilum]